MKSGSLLAFHTKLELQEKRAMILLSVSDIVGFPFRLLRSHLAKVCHFLT